ncbi:MAG: ABC transporter permease [Paracoccaceae bacterium]
MAYFISFYGGNRKALWLFLITIPFWTSYLLRMFLWKVILGYNGVLNSFLLWLEMISEPLTFILYNSNAVIIALTHGWAPFAILPIFVSLEKIDRSLLEASRDLGDGPIKQFFRVILPLSMPGVVGAALIIFIPTVGDYITPKLVGGTDGLMIANMIQVQFSKANNAPSRCGFICFLIGNCSIYLNCFCSLQQKILKEVLRWVARVNFSKSLPLHI